MGTTPTSAHEMLSFTSSPNQIMGRKLSHKDKKHYSFLSQKESARFYKPLPRLTGLAAEASAWHSISCFIEEKKSEALHPSESQGAKGKVLLCFHPPR